MNKLNAQHAACAIANRHLKPGPAVQNASGLHNSHLRWMILEIQNEAMSENKTMRWLGYIQGVVVARGLATLEEMKLLNKEFSND